MQLYLITVWETDSEDTQVFVRKSSIRLSDEQVWQRFLATNIDAEYLRNKGHHISQYAIEDIADLE